MPKSWTVDMSLGLHVTRAILACLPRLLDFHVICLMSFLSLNLHFLCYCDIALYPQNSELECMAQTSPPRHDVGVQGGTRVPQLGMTVQTLVQGRAGV